MSDAAEFNKAGATVAGVIGAVLILVSSPFTVAFWNDGAIDPPDTFDVGWDMAALSAGVTASTTAVGTDGEETLTVEDALVAGVRVSFQCSDTAPTTGNAAQFTLSVFDGNDTQVGESESGPCSAMNNQEFDFVAMAAPERATVRATSLDAAQDEVWEETADGNTTATFRILVQVSRAPGTVPIGTIPGQGGSASADASAFGLVWIGTAVERQPEVVR